MAYVIHDDDELGLAESTRPKSAEVVGGLNPGHAEVVLWAFSFFSL